MLTSVLLNLIHFDYHYPLHTLQLQLIRQNLAKFLNANYSRSTSIATYADNNNAPNIYTYCTASTAEGFTGLIFAMLESK